MLVRVDAVGGGAAAFLLQVRVAVLRMDGAVLLEEPALDVAHALRRLPLPRQRPLREECERVPQALEVVDGARGQALQLSDARKERRAAAGVQLAPIRVGQALAGVGGHAKVDKVRPVLGRPTRRAEQRVQRLDVIMHVPGVVQLPQAVQQVAAEHEHGLAPERGRVTQHILLLLRATTRPTPLCTHCAVIPTARLDWTAE